MSPFSNGLTNMKNSSPVNKYFSEYFGVLDAFYLDVQYPREDSFNLFSSPFNHNVCIKLYYNFGWVAVGLYDRVHRFEVSRNLDL
jgi:hypothetical protein